MYNVKRFLDCHVPINVCNFNCEYCTVSQWRELDEDDINNYTPFKYPVSQMAKSLNPKRMGGICSINLCGNGETLLHPQIVESTELLLQDGHFVSIVTNGTVTKAIDYLCNLPEKIRSHIFFKFSFHYTELIRLNFLDLYFNNINKAHNSGISFTVELVASDGNIPYIEEIKKVCIENLGVLCHLTDARANTTKDIVHLTKIPLDEHIKIWSQFNSPLFDYRQKTWGQNRKNNFCYSGIWSFNLDLHSGKLKQCYRNSSTIQFIFSEINEPIHFLPCGHFCPSPHCFNSHIFDCLCGVIPEIESPMYSELRNRILPNGTEWLKAPYKEIYSHKINENNDLLSQEKIILSNGIMHLTNNLEPPKDFNSLCQKYILSIDKNMYIYGIDLISTYLIKNFKFNKYSEKLNDLIVVTDFSHFAQIKSYLSKHTQSQIISIVEFLLT